MTKVVAAAEFGRLHLARQLGIKDVQRYDGNKCACRVFALLVTSFNKQLKFKILVNNQSIINLTTAHQRIARAIAQL